MDAEEHERVNSLRRERCAQECSQQAPELREQNYARRREQYSLEIAQQPAEEREQNNEQRREEYAQERAQQPAEKGAQVNRKRHQSNAESRARRLSKNHNSFIRETGASLSDFKLTPFCRGIVAHLPQVRSSTVQG